MKVCDVLVGSSRSTVKLRFISILPWRITV